MGEQLQGRSDNKPNPTLTTPSTVFLSRRNIIEAVPSRVNVCLVAQGVL